VSNPSDLWAILESLNPGQDTPARDRQRHPSPELPVVEGFRPLVVERTLAWLGRNRRGCLGVSGHGTLADEAPWGCGRVLRQSL